MDLLKISACAINFAVAKKNGNKYYNKYYNK